jgi:diaminohydroxyphosphoribosylaminopyrimidine deaminase/5-amino-6-(5-phosphoribosylamino)uracil reductase
MTDPDPTDGDWLAAAVELSRRSPPSGSAYAVGAIVVVDGAEVASGWSRDVDPAVHAEESALSRVDGAGLAGATLYTSLEPCTTRRSRQHSCTELILEAGIRRVVFALREPPVLSDCDGAERLAAAGVEVVELPALAAAVREVNAPVLARR